MIHPGPASLRLLAHVLHVCGPQERRAQLLVLQRGGDILDDR
jgi:hypothetical protein